MALRGHRWLLTATLGAATMLAAAALSAAPITTREGVLPPGTDLNEEPLDRPTELFYSELAGGKRSYLLNLGDLAFSSPAIFGGVARQAGISCSTCHQQGAGNPRLYVPGMSSRPGTFDASSTLFNPKADNGVLDAVTPPSLRGVKYLAPYGHDGRFPTLREFIRNAIVNEFAGPEPSPQIVDALVAYVREIAFLPNDKLGPGGHLTAKASAAAHRGEVLFSKPFPHDPSLSCAACHKPAGAFVDHTVHDVGSGGLFKTLTLINANFNAPYFHDGRYDSYNEVVSHFDRVFALGLSPQERSDLVAYLSAVGDADKPFTRYGVAGALAEIADFASVLDITLPARNVEVINLVVDGVGNEWRELGENFPSATDTTVHGGLAERKAARRVALGASLALRQIAMAVADGNFDDAAQTYADYRKLAKEARPVLEAAAPWSLFDPQNRERHLKALQQLDRLAVREPARGEGNQR
jgi:cytochrome c peroxidase